MAAVSQRNLKLYYHLKLPFHYKIEVSHFSRDFPMLEYLIISVNL